MKLKLFAAFAVCSGLSIAVGRWSAGYEQYYKGLEYGRVLGSYAGTNDDYAHSVATKEIHTVPDSSVDVYNSYFKTGATLGFAIGVSTASKDDLDKLIATQALDDPTWLESWVKDNSADRSDLTHARLTKNEKICFSLGASVGYEVKAVGGSKLDLEEIASLTTSANDESLQKARLWFEQKRKELYTKDSQ